MILPYTARHAHTYTLDAGLVTQLRCPYLRADYYLTILHVGDQDCTHSECFLPNPALSAGRQGKSAASNGIEARIPTDRLFRKLLTTLRSIRLMDLSRLVTRQRAILRLLSQAECNNVRSFDKAERSNSCDAYNAVSFPIIIHDTLL